MMTGILTVMVYPVRACGMEARGKTQHRTQVKPCKAGPIWVSVPVNATPNFQPWSERYWGRWRREAFHSYPRRSPQIRNGGRAQESDDACLMSEEKSDHPIVAMNLVKADGAKGVMG
jgi:hypothetical protein